MKKILVPTDLSKNAENAVAYAFQFAKETKSELVFLHATHPMIDMPDATLEFYDPIIYRDEEEQRKFVQNHIQLALDSIRYTSEDFTYSIELRLGFAVDEIISTAKKIKCDLIIMGTKGATGISKMVFGSITADVIRKSEISVLAIPENFTYKSISKIVFATDYEGISNRKTLLPLFEVANTFDSSIMMFHAIESKEPIAAYIEELQVWKTEQKLAHIKHSNSIASCTNIADGILDFAHEQDASIIAIIPHTYNFFTNLLHKSISKEIAFESKLPILALH
jgi:nucleotide-binding universal stress UspA family protein